MCANMTCQRPHRTWIAPSHPHLYITVRHELGHDRREAAVDDGILQRKAEEWLSSCIMLYRTAPYTVVLRSREWLSSPFPCPAPPRVDRELETIYPAKRDQVHYAIYMHKTCELHLQDPRTQDGPACLLWGKGYPPPRPAGCRLSRCVTGMGGREEGSLLLTRVHRKTWGAHDGSPTLTCSNKATLSFP